MARIWKRRDTAWIFMAQIKLEESHFPCRSQCPQQMCGRLRFQISHRSQCFTWAQRHTEYNARMQGNPEICSIILSVPAPLKHGRDSSWEALMELARKKIWELIERVENGGWKVSNQNLTLTPHGPTEWRLWLFSCLNDEIRQKKITP